MEYRFLGRSGLKVSVLGYGCWLNLDPDSLERNKECLDLAFREGINFFDTAEEYSDGKSEIALGIAIKTLKWKRSEYVVSTKIYWGGSGVNERGLSRKHIVEGLNASLERLQLDYVDLVFAHRPDDSTPMEEIVRAFNWVIDQGKAFYWGTSEWSSEQIMNAHRVAEKLNLIGPLMEQPQYNMFVRERFEKEYEPLYRNFKMGTTTFSPLAYGLLTGKYQNGIPKGSRFDIYRKVDTFVDDQASSLETDKGKAKLEKIEKLKSLAQDLGCTISQLAIAWCIKNEHISSVILGVSNKQQLQENLAAVAVIEKLTPKVISRIEEILQNKPIAASLRY